MSKLPKATGCRSCPLSRRSFPAAALAGALSAALGGRVLEEA